MATEKISTSIIADDAVTGAKIENNPTVAGTLNVTGAFTAAGGIANAGTITAGTLGSSVVFPTGSVLQVQSTTKTDVTSTSGLSVDTLTDITGMSVAITPKTTTSKFFVTFNIMLGIGSADTLTIQLKRGTTDIAQGSDYDGGYRCTTESIRSSTEGKYSVYALLLLHYFIYK